MDGHQPAEGQGQHSALCVNTDELWLHDCLHLRRSSAVVLANLRTPPLLVHAKLAASALSLSTLLTVVVQQKYVQTGLSVAQGQCLAEEPCSLIDPPTAPNIFIKLLALIQQHGELCQFMPVQSDRLGLVRCPANLNKSIWRYNSGRREGDFLLCGSYKGQTDGTVSVVSGYHLDMTSYQGRKLVNCTSSYGQLLDSI